MGEETRGKRPKGGGIELLFLLFPELRRKYMEEVFFFQNGKGIKNLTQMMQVYYDHNTEEKGLPL